eukprot:m.115205 g.115205  ORF g.115205 m.115205 type:complete len:151 (-) comp14193_c0_seq6:92-544(-)
MDEYGCRIKFMAATHRPNVSCIRTVCSSKWLGSLSKSLACSYHKHVLGEFSTQTFEWPRDGICLNAAAKWEQEPGGNCDEKCQAYVMVSVTDASSNIIPGFAKERCVMMDFDSTNMRLAWNSSDTSTLVGRNVQLRIYFRDATIFAIDEC